MSKDKESGKKPIVSIAIEKPKNTMLLTGDDIVDCKVGKTCTLSVKCKCVGDAIRSDFGEGEKKYREQRFEIESVGSCCCSKSTDNKSYEKGKGI